MHSCPPIRRAVLGHSTQTVMTEQAVNHLFNTPTVLSILARPSSARMSPAGGSAAAGFPGLRKSLVSRLSTPTAADTAALSSPYAKSKAALHGKSCLSLSATQICTHEDSI